MIPDTPNKNQTYIDLLHKQEQLRKDKIVAGPRMEQLQQQLLREELIMSSAEIIYNTKIAFEPPTKQ